MALAATWIVTVPVANMHSAPDAKADVVSQAIYGTEVTVVASQPGWKRIRTPGAYEGWAADSSLLELANRGYPDGERALWVSSLFANLYREPDVTTGQPLLTVPFETRLEVVSEPVEEERRWIETRLPDERRVWIQRGDVRFDDSALSAGETIALARQFVGLPYLWGGVSTFGYDCSGFTQTLCRRRGIRIPRDSGPQARWEGMGVTDRAGLEPGDLLYFGESVDRITHTGMYIGGGEFIHATAYKKPVVQISSLGDPHWSELLVACRRPGAAPE